MYIHEYTDVIDWRMPTTFEYSAFSSGSLPLGNDHNGAMGNEAIIQQRRSLSPSVSLFLSDFPRCLAPSLSLSLSLSP